MSEQKLTRRQQAEIYLQHPNMRRYLDVLSYAEGTEKHGYHTKFGGGRIDDLSHHPNINWGKTGDGPTSATGRYQFVKGTWNEQAKLLGLNDFGPQSQDLAAVSLIMRRGAVDDILNGDIDNANRKLSPEWASLPYHKSKHQSKRTSDEIAQVWEKLGGKDYAMAAQQYDYSTTTVPDTAQYKVPEKTLRAFSPEKELTPLSSSYDVESTNLLNQVIKGFEALNGTMDEMVGMPSVPITPKANYDAQLASAFGITPSTSGKIPDYIGDMIKSIYDQTA